MYPHLALRHKCVPENVNKCLAWLKKKKNVINKTIVYTEQ